jgi:hypothetical protein
MPRFRAPMISTAYEPHRETARFVWRKIAFAFACFGLVVAPRGKGREIDGGLEAALMRIPRRRHADPDEAREVGRLVRGSRALADARTLHQLAERHRRHDRAVVIEVAG